MRAAGRPNRKPSEIWADSGFCSERGALFRVHADEHRVLEQRLTRNLRLGRVPRILGCSSARSAAEGAAGPLSGPPPCTFRTRACPGAIIAPRATRSRELFVTGSPLTHE